MWFSTVSKAFLGLSILSGVTLAAQLSRALTTTALSVNGRFIVDTSGQRVKLRCLNWAGADKTKIPEGLQYQPVDATALWIFENGFNCVRLTYSMDMALDPTQTVHAAWVQAAGSTAYLPELMDTFSTAVGKNPWLQNASTLEAYGAVISALGDHNVMVIMDNHNSHASWCCSLDDGNGWWDTDAVYNSTNSRYFNTARWLAGLQFMANFSLSHPNVVGISLRNEIRRGEDQDVDGTHAAWWDNIPVAAATVHAGNPDALIMIGGVDYFNDFSFLKTKPLNRSEFDNKVVYEYHTYSWGSDAFGDAYVTSSTQTNCTPFNTYLDEKVGYLLEEGKPYTGPVWMGEFGWSQVPQNDTTEEVYKTCLIEWMSNNDMDWSLWALQGSYYFRTKEVDMDETFGILNHNWTNFRYPGFLNKIGKMWITNINV
ncbi:hypothetical protein BP6252_01793 [Coleophoma cylindrospora]|uniref:Glycoside hydrolase family 5 domain-containing protein n=1 Tax=Coleophoma cylindrospora TaxID=1849047 RepID=A0A3D8SUA7_9HELO|nr:hypothetical protein BP6252_01793 [Coleophoma cylindrospora]